MIEELKLITRTSSGRLIKVPAAIERRDGRIYFVKSPFSLKDEIKAMKGSKWHGFEEEGDGPYSGKKVWSVEDCQRNGFQLSLLCGDDVFEWFDRELVHHEYQRPLMPHQKDLTDAGLTYHYQLWAAEMGTGKGGSAGTKVATPTGWTTLGVIQVGDEIVNPDGGTTHVKGVYRRGGWKCFGSSFSDGSSTVCSGDHLWNVRTASRKFRGLPYETLELHEILDRGLFYENGNAKHYIPMVSPVEYRGANTAPAAYLVGYVLGNGGLTGWATWHVRP